MSTTDFSQHTHTVRFTGGVITHTHPLYPGVHPHPFEPTPQSSDLSPISADALLNRAAKAVAAAGLDDAARLVEHARPETAARLRALAYEVRSWE